MAGFAYDALVRAFDGLADELTEPDDISLWFTDGRALQVLAYVARAARTPQPARGPLIDVTPVQADGKLLHTAYDEPVS